MVRLRIVVEGESEERALSVLLREHLRTMGVQLEPLLIRGNLTWGRLLRNVFPGLHESSKPYVSTFFDYFRRGRDFPSVQPEARTSRQKANSVQEWMRSQVASRLQSGSGWRFIPYVQMHEFEALLFSDVDAMAGEFQLHPDPRRDLAARLREIRDGFPTPEDINDGSETAPSKRLLALAPSYDKAFFGEIIAGAIGLPAIRAACPLFNEWVSTLEDLGSAPPAG